MHKHQFSMFMLPAYLGHLPFTREISPFKNKTTQDAFPSYHFHMLSEHFNRFVNLGPTTVLTKYLITWILRSNLPITLLNCRKVLLYLVLCKEYLRNIYYTAFAIVKNHAKKPPEN